MTRTLSAALFLLLAPLALTGQSPTPSPSPQPSPGAGSEPTFPTQVELVNVDVVVTDKKGEPVAGLTKDDFTITEDGQPQTLVSFETVAIAPTNAPPPAPRPRISTNMNPADRTGRSFVVIFDNVHLTPFQARRAKTAVAEFLQTGVRPGDRVMLVATGGEAWWSARMDEGRDELMTLLKRLDGRLIPETTQDRITDYEAMRIQVFSDPQVEARVSRRFQTYNVAPQPNPNSRAGQATSSDTTDPMVRSRASDVYYQSVTRSRLTLEAMERALKSLTGVKGRKSMILVSEGFIYDTNLDEFKSVLEASRRAAVAIYFLDTRGLQGLPAYFSAEFGPALDTQDLGAAFSEAWEASQGSENLAADSGGFTVSNTNDLTKGIKKIADESKLYYLVGYNPTNPKRDGKFRKISVKVNRKGVEIRARKGYYAPLEGKAPPKRKPGSVDPAIQEALDSPFDVDQVPIRMTAYSLDETIVGKAHVLVASDVDVRGFAFQEKEGRLADSLEFLLVVAHRETGEYFRYDQTVDMKLHPETREKLAKTWYNIVRDFELPPGGYQAKVVVRDKQSGRVGTVIHNFEVPDLTQLRTSTPLLTDILEPPGPGSKAATPRPVLVVRRNFPEGTRLFCEFEVYGAAKEQGSGMPKVSAGYVIQKNDSSESVVVRVEPTVIRPTSLGKLSRIVGPSLQGITPGEYEFVLNVKDEIAGRSVQVREPFTVDPATGS